MIRIVAPDFVAGVVLRGLHVDRTAPILRYMLGWDTQRVYRHVRRKGWSMEWL